MTYRETEKIRYKGTQPHGKLKDIWGTEYETAFEESGWDPSTRKARVFLNQYGVHPKVVATLSLFLGPISGTSFSPENCLLMGLRELRGDRTASVVESFDADESTIRNAQKLIFQKLSDFSYILSSHFPATRAEVEEIIENLEKAGRPFPEFPFVGDCTDLPIWTRYAEFFSHKRNLQSAKGFRSAVICRRDTMMPVWVKTGAAPASFLGSDSKMLLSSNIHNAMVNLGVKTLWDGGISENTVPWVVTKSPDPTTQHAFKVERAQIEHYFARVKNRFSYFQQPHTLTLTQKNAQEIATMFDLKFQAACVLDRRNG